MEKGKRVEVPKVAIVVDWLVRKAGAEKVLEYLLKCYPEADLFSLIDVLPASDDRSWLSYKKVTTSFLQQMPFIRRHYPKFLPLMPLAIESLDLRGYDIVLSSSHCVAKGIITSPDQLHVCYIHSPMRYAWDLQRDYLESNSGFLSAKINCITNIFKSWFLHRMRIWDAVSAARVDHFIANSHFISRRVKKVYKRDSTVIFPPVDIMDVENIPENRDSFYFLVSRFTEYKNIDLIVKAFAKMPNKTLKIIGDGPMWNQVSRLAAPNVELLGYQSDEVVIDHFCRAKASIFAALEDFGIASVEAQGYGCPIIAYGYGGICDIVVENKTGIFFYHKTEQSICDAIDIFENHSEISSQDCIDNAQRFAPERFMKQVTGYVEDMWSKHLAGKEG